MIAKDPHQPLTDEELAAIKRSRELTVGDWERMTPEQKIKDIQDFIKEFVALDGNINKLDPNDPAWLRERDDEENW